MHHDEFLKICKDRYSDADVLIIARALEFATVAHEGQERDDGSPYIYHPIAVAGIAAEYHKGPKTVIAALLHDTVEDTSVTLADINNEFGADIALVIDGVTKADKAQFADAKDAKIATYQKLIVAAAGNPHALTVKLCDRLHNMRTLGATSVEKQQRIARETLQIYAPIAHRLSLHYIYRELEDRAMTVLYPERMKKLKEERDLITQGRSALLEEMAKSINEILVPHDVAPEHRIREKHLTSLWRKEQEGYPLYSIHDAVSLVLEVKSIAHCYLVLGGVHALYRPVVGRFKDYIALPKGNGYRSLHTTIYHPTGTAIQIQIRTTDMDRAAEWGEMIDHSDWLENLRVSESFLETFERELFRDEIYIYNSDGECVILPQGATAEDYARRAKTTKSLYHEGQLLNKSDKLDNGWIIETR